MLNELYIVSIVTDHSEDGGGDIWEDFVCVSEDAARAFIENEGKRYARFCGCYWWILFTTEIKNGVVRTKDIVARSQEV